MKNTVNYYKNQKEFHVFVASTFSDLRKFRKEEDKTSFNELLLKTLPQVKRYINKRLNTALSKRNLPRGKYSPDDFLDELFLVVYDHFEDVRQKEDLYPWLFKKADELLENSISEEEFDEYFLTNIDEYSKPEWDEMEEKFSTDGDGDLVMIDELDDSSYHKNDYVLNHVFVDDDSNEMIAQIDKEWSEDKIRKHVAMVLHYLPLATRSVYELATEYHFEVAEIAKIQNQEIKEVQRLLEDARQRLKTSFLKRVLFN
ncbi:MAG: sigma-70 family RNA polymerase sigma factor [Flavobacteriaceae bacterium]